MYSRALARIRWTAAALAWSILTVVAVAQIDTVWSDASPNPDELVDAELVAEFVSVEPGRPFTVALRMAMADGWHTYWLNPGDAGMPTTIAWDLPEGFSAGPIRWPYPHRFDESGVTTYAYGGEILLLTEITPPDDLVPGPEVALQARADWLVCADICLPGGADLDLELPVIDVRPARNATWAPEIEQTRRALPQPSDAWEVTAARHGTGYLIRLSPTDSAEAAAPDPGDIYFFSDAPEVVEHGAAQLVSHDGGAYIVSLEASDYAAGPADRLTGVLVAESGWEADGAVPGLAVDAPVEDELAEAALPATNGLSLALALVFAFVGGLILNLMPCVFPVLSIKILGFVQHGKKDPASVRRHGYAFGVGVVLSFLLLAGLLLVLRAGGERLGWGFQLQEPWFVGVMAFVIFGLGLSLMGTLEIGMSLMRVGAVVPDRTGYSGSFWSGVLATIVATPCTAPFMGSALGYAVAQPALVALAVFGVLGVGMAAPYVVLSMAPALTRRLPRPGPWMETFKQAMAFPLFLTVIWLVWVFARQTGIDGTAYLLLGLLLIGLAVWILGRWPAVQTSFPGRMLTRGLVAVAVAGAVFLAVVAGRLAMPSDAVGSVVSGRGIDWEPYAAEVVEAYRSEGRPVFVDFTAAWCLSCKVNERVAFSDRDVRARFAELDIVPVKADWTSRDPEITAALESFGRSGVPLYVLYTGYPDAEPLILPEILTPGIVLDALDAVRDQATRRTD